MGGGDHRRDEGEAYPRGGPGRPAPAPPPAQHVTLSIPARWSEAVAYATGVRCARDELDEVPTLVRQGLPVERYLDLAEITAMLDLGPRIWERWFRHGWAAWTDSQDGG